MENLLLKKLQIRDGFKVVILNAPENVLSTLGEFPSTIQANYGLVQNADAYLIFAVNKAELFEALKNIATSILSKTVVWIFYPKTKSKLASDLNLMQSWSDLTAIGLAPCSSAAVDETWTAIRIKPAFDQKKSGLGNAEIAKGEYGKYIDVVNKIIVLPEDLHQRLLKAPLAYSFYEQLSYSNRKEYVLWVLSAKQEKTRVDRIDKTIEKLLQQRKNPSEKA